MVFARILMLGGLFALVLVLAIPSVNASYIDNSKWCPLMYSIYGCCSEQLINNYLLHISQPFKAKPQKAILASTIPSNIALGNSVGLNASESKCWFWSGTEWKKCRMLK